MKIKLSQLRRIIKEEVGNMLSESEQAIIRRGDELFLRDDEGNEEYYSPVKHSDYEYLKDGQAAPFETSSGGYGYDPGSGYETRRGGRYGRRW